MPLINLDAKGLEWHGCLFLSKDKTGRDEYLSGTDQHADNQRTFGLGEGDDGRLLAKKFVFRLIYGGTAPAYAQDADFIKVSTDENFWQEVIDKFYGKYDGIKAWHESLMMEAMTTGRVVLPTGRYFPFAPEQRGAQWPRTKILNYPVQGFGADLMALARVLLWRRLKSFTDVKFICTVHDSIVLDVHHSLVDVAISEVFDVWKELPVAFEKRFKVPMDLPPRVEVSFGPNWKEQTKV